MSEWAVPWTIANKVFHAFFGGDWVLLEFSNSSRIPKLKRRVRRGVNLFVSINGKRPRCHQNLSKRLGCHRTLLK